MNVKMFLPLVLLYAIAAMPSPARAQAGSDLATPTNLTRAVTVTDCTSHMSLDSLVSQCNTAIPTKLVLMWSFDQSACQTKPCAAPDGFNVVRSSSGTPYAIAKVQNQEPGQTAVIFDEPRADAIGSCFKVVAYKGATDFSVPSAPFCTVIEDETLSPVQSFMTLASGANKTTFIISCPSSGVNGIGQGLKANGSPSQLMLVGFVRFDNSCSAAGSIRQGGLRFDLTKLPPGQIAKATLEVHVATAAVNDGVSNTSGVMGKVPNGNEHTSYRSCAAFFGFPTNWSPGDPLPNYMTYDQVGTIPLTDGSMSVDLTAMVRDWLKPGGINNGVVFTPQGGQPQGHINGGYITGLLAGNGNENGECMTIYRDASLKITFKH